MKIGVDLRVLQIGHQYRGIGEVTKQCLNRMFEIAVADTKNQPTFVFFMYELTADEIDPKSFLHIPEGLQYEEVSLGKQPIKNPHRSVFEKLGRKYRTLYGNPLPHAKKCDVLLQFDYALGVAKHPKTVLVAHDIIPYIFWSDYFESAWSYFKRKAARTTLRTMEHNYEFVHILKRSHKRAARIICVSESTRNDLQKYLHVPVKKMKVVHLGVSKMAASTDESAASIVEFPTKPFLLFVGGVDARRRRIDDIIAAYNNLRASGRDIQLVLVGDNFRSPETIPNKTVRRAVMGSSYIKDIITLGYVDDRTKQELFKRALSFVFPTTYEGFGIPILEAMIQGCPVITYKNSSTAEVGGDYALYANDWTSIKMRVDELMDMSDTQRQKLTAQAKEHAEQFTWEATGKKIYRQIIACQ
jgi:glycosyltransferase involved in cell wall biosynthesis